MSESAVVHPVFLTQEQLERVCRVGFKRASGPGGQNRNKVETAVELTHSPTGVSGAASERRAQLENRRVALDRLRLNLALEIRTPACDQGLQVFSKYNRNARVSISESNWDWPILLCELLNRLAVHEWELAHPAEQLATSASQLIKLLKQSPGAWQLVNRERTAIGKHALK